MDGRAKKHLNSTTPVASCLGFGQVRNYAILYPSHADKLPSVDGSNEKRGLSVYDNLPFSVDFLPTLDYLDLPTMFDLNCPPGTLPIILVYAAHL